MKNRIAAGITAANAQGFFDVVDAACDVGIEEACGVLSLQFQDWKTPDARRVYTTAAIEANAAEVVQFECRLLSSGVTKDCRAVLEMPQGHVGVA